MNLTDNFKQDITLAVNVWTELLNEYFSDGIEYIFTKGSSVKKWESDIDYVPIISDVDIHIKLRDKRKLLQYSNSFEVADSFSKNYEQNFNSSCTDINYTPTHFPRVQIVQLEFSGRKGYVVPPRQQDVVWIQGKGDFPEEFDHGKLKLMDKKNLLGEKLFIDSIPNTLLELSGLEYYTLLYKINSRISPSPIRLLTQVVNKNPHDIWASNKTSIRNLLLDNNYNEIAEYYEQYYFNGWKLFEKQFMDMSLYREMIKIGYYLLKNCYSELKKLSID